MSFPAGEQHGDVPAARHAVEIRHAVSHHRAVVVLRVIVAVHSNESRPARCRTCAQPSAHRPCSPPPPKDGADAGDILHVDLGERIVACSRAPLDHRDAYGVALVVARSVVPRALVAKSVEEPLAAEPARHALAKRYHIHDFAAGNIQRRPGRPSRRFGRFWSGRGPGASVRSAYHPPTPRRMRAASAA